MFWRIRFFIKNKIYNFKKRCQRFKRGYSCSDVWDMFDWFLEVIPPMLTKLRDEGCGVPNDLWLEGADNEREKWEVVLTEMIDCLDNMKEDRVLEKLGLYENGVYKSKTLEDCRNVNRFMEKNKDRFFELFSKYFYHLWD